MLQRSPTYVVARPASDELRQQLRARFGARVAYHMIRWRNVLFGMYFFQLCRRKPERAKQLILGGVRMALGKDFDVADAFHADATIRGSSGCASCRTATCSARSAKAAPRW